MGMLSSFFARQLLSVEVFPQYYEFFNRFIGKFNHILYLLISIIYITSLAAQQFMNLKQDIFTCIMKRKQEFLVHFYDIDQKNSKS